MFDTFNLRAEIRRFEILKMFYPPKGRLPVDSNRGLIVFTYVFFCVRKNILDFQFTGAFLPLRNLENVLSPEPKGTEGGPIVFTYVLFCVRKRILDFQNLKFQAAFLKS